MPHPRPLLLRTVPAKKEVLSGLLWPCHPRHLSIGLIFAGTLHLCQKSNQIVPRQELGKWQEGWGCGKWSRKLKQRWPCGLAKAGPALRTWDPWLHKQFEPPRIKSPRIHWVSTILVTWPNLILEKTCYTFQCEWYCCQTALLEPSP